MAFVRGFAGALIANVVLYNTSVTLFTVGTVAGIWLGQQYNLPNVRDAALG